MAHSVHREPDSAARNGSAGDVLEYWFGPDAGDERVLRNRKHVWFRSRPETDREIRARFAGLVDDAARGRLDDWPATARGRLALIVLLDQFTRNIFRGTAAAFAHDARALALCLDGLDAGADRELALTERVFFCMPMQHAESLEVQTRSVDVFESLCRKAASDEVRRALEEFADYARQHRDIVARFGRFPHRNAALGRPSTAEEIEFLEGGAASFGQ